MPLLTFTEGSRLVFVECTAPETVLSERRLASMFALLGRLLLPELPGRVDEFEPEWPPRLPFELPGPREGADCEDVCDCRPRPWASAAGAAVSANAANKHAADFISRFILFDF